MSSLVANSSAVIAGYNGPDQTVVAGTAEAVDDACARARACRLCRDLRHKRFPTPEAEYRKWKARFDRWWEANGRPDHAWPDFYPGKRHWTAPA